MPRLPRVIAVAIVALCGSISWADSRPPVSPSRSADPGARGKCSARLGDQQKAALQRWVYVAASPGGAGPRIAELEELWIGPDGRATWRRLREQQVVSVSTPPIRPQQIENLRSTAKNVAPVHRHPGDYQAPVDGWVGPNLTVAISNGQVYTEWADEDRLLPRAMVAAARALLEVGRSYRPAAPGVDTHWLQLLPLDDLTEAILQNQGLIVSVPADDVTANSTLAHLLAFPFSWVQIPAGVFALTPKIQLRQSNPTVVMKVQGRAYQIVLQSGSPLWR